MKVSFALASKTPSKQNIKAYRNEGDNVTTDGPVYVTEFDPSEDLRRSQTKKTVIPPKPNEWRPHKKMKNLELPLESGGKDLQFEPAPADLSAEADSNMPYGLIVRQSLPTVTKSDADAHLYSQVNGSSVEGVLLQKLQADLKRLPDEGKLDDYNDVPVEGFGAALLAGYGWYEGRGIGKNAKADVQVVQYERRNAKEGIGFIHEIHGRAANTNTDKQNVVNKEKRREKDGDESGGLSLSVGKDVRVIAGRTLGSKGRIVEILDDDIVLLKLRSSGEQVKVRVGDVAELGSKQEEKCLRKLKELKINGPRDHNRSHRTGKNEIHEERRESKLSREEGRKRKEVKTGQVSWLSSHIRVRIISKNLQGGKLYLKKGEIVDVVGPTTCDISMDGSRELVQGVDQDHLQTALPRLGGPVLVLFGKYKGVYGSLMERDTERESGVIRDFDSHALLNVRLEQIAEYIGDPSYIGY